LRRAIDHSRLDGAITAFPWPDYLVDSAQSLKPAAGGNSSGTSRSGVVFPRLLIGLVVLICAEVFSGASIQVGLWNPWTWVVTYWLYFAHFFFFTTLDVRTGRTSLSSLYLWGILFGLYEFWITKVIWHGYGGDGKFVMGSIGPYGYSEISMAFIFHPVASFILPLAVTCLLCPPLRRLFPDLAWFKAENDRAQQESLLLREEMRIKDARMALISPHRRPYYPPTERMAILELTSPRDLNATRGHGTGYVRMDLRGFWLREGFQ